MLAWQIEEGYVKTALSIFFFTKKADAGDVIGKHQIIIKTIKYVSTLDSLYVYMLKLY